ncbi:hypothetical protein AGMMS49921_03470 [Endomicrobiia bacterium]|nr:hypothetical protein AGMMS49921_03470 [Endomicrobiia bacterium]
MCIDNRRRTILVYLKIDVDLCKERHKTHGRYYLIGLRQNTYKHTNPKKEIREALTDKRR